MTLRHASLDDRPRVIEMALRFLQETPYGAVLTGATRERLGALFERVVLNLGVVVVAEIDGQLVGFLALVALPHPLTGRSYADEIAWWVEPEARHGVVGTALLGAAEQWAREHGLEVLKMVAPAGTHVGRFYERRGFRPVETAYQKRLDVAA